MDMHSFYKFSNFLLTFIGIIILAGFTSCKKLQARKLAGEYKCMVNFHSWNGEIISDNSYIETVEVSQWGRYIEVFDHRIDVEEVCGGHEYVENDYNVFKLRFEDETMYLYRSSRSPGGGYNVTYVGHKQ